MKPTSDVKSKCADFLDIEEFKLKKFLSREVAIYVYLQIQI
jgi:hypothetical protein